MPCGASQVSEQEAVPFIDQGVAGVVREAETILLLSNGADSGEQ
jgi:hypothetical protein